MIMIGVFVNTIPNLYAARTRPLGYTLFKARGRNTIHNAHHEYYKPPVFTRCKVGRYESLQIASHR